MDDDEKYKRLLPKIINIPGWKERLKFDTEDVFDGKRNFFGWILLDEIAYDNKRQALEQLEEIKKRNIMIPQWFIGCYFSVHKKVIQTKEFKYFILISFFGTKEFYYNQSVLEILENFEKHEAAQKEGRGFLGCGM